ncbi:1-deoxy-D-xylulose-5-phosphate synthase [Mesoaciditoga sp.]
MKTPEILKDEPLFKKLKNMSCEELRELANVIRKYITEVVSSGNGHMASNLGTVDLALALYKIFPPDENYIVWDTGHQAYTHKILTGRAKSLPTIRKFGGISGYPNIHESPYDRFGVGHAATSISAALGIEAANKILKKDGKTIVVIGDGAMTSGTALEALNQIKSISSNLKIVLNDNGMSISPSVGQLSKKILTHLRTSKGFRTIDNKFYDLLKENDLEQIADKVKLSIKKLLLSNNFFEEMGLKYLGPIDGHDIKMLLRAFESLNEIEGPVVVHVVTQKGKGVSYAEENPTKFHGVSMIDPKTGISLEVKKEKHSYSEVFGRVLSLMADIDERIIGITAAMEEGTGLKFFHERHPEKFYDLGITESLCTTFAAGAATRGLKPVVAIYSTFLQRAFDQIIHDVALQNLDVVFGIDRAGLVGEDGPTHHGTFDISYLNLIPNMKILAPSSTKELSSMMKAIIGRVKGPIAIRYPRKSEKVNITEVILAPILDEPFRWQKIVNGKDGTILAVGSMVEVALKAAEILKGKGLSVSVYNCRSVKPLDVEALEEIKLSPHIWTLEEGSVIGGFGSSVVLKLQGYRNKVEVLGIDDNFVEHGTREELLEKVGLSAEKVAQRMFFSLTRRKWEG